MDAESELFLHSQQGDGPTALMNYVKVSEVFSFPVCKMSLEKIKYLKEEQSETIFDYITRAEDLQYDFRQIGEAVSEQMFISILKGLPKNYNRFITLAKFSSDKKELQEIKRDLVNFEYASNSISKEESVFLAKTPIKC